MRRSRETRWAGPASASGVLGDLQVQRRRGHAVPRAAARRPAPGRSQSCRLEADRLTATRVPGRRRARHGTGSACSRTCVVSRPISPALLGQRQEPVRVEQPAIRVLPAHQRLHPGDAPVAQVELAAGSAGPARRGRGRRAAPPACSAGRACRRRARRWQTAHAALGALGLVHRACRRVQQQGAASPPWPGHTAMPMLASTCRAIAARMNGRAARQDPLGDAAAPAPRRPPAGARRTRRRRAGPACRRDRAPGAAAGRPGAAARRRRGGRSCR